ncbi:MAG: site-2 protease family protein [Armatimonadota bacterium]|nr:MAG: site-2 protease family protein [Armatimonadota bacterium]
MDVFARIIAIALAFGTTVLVHEAGHFVAARLSGMAVYEFSIGFGRPLLFWFRRGETQYSFRLWPFFSFTRVAGMEPGDDHPEGFHKKSRLAQMFVLATGCVMNFLLAVAIFVFMGAVLGRPVEVSNTVDRVFRGSPAEQVGLAPGDELIGINGRTDLSHGELVKAIQQHPEQPIVLEIERAGERLSINITPEKVMGWTEDGERSVPQGRIGVGFRARMERLGIWESVVGGFKLTVAAIYELAGGIFKSIRHGKGPELVGPVGVLQLMYKEAEVDWRYFFFIFAMVTVSIGFINLLPIPPLDGSRLVIVALEAIRRKPFDKRKEIIVHLIGFVLLLGLFVLLTFQDITRILVGGDLGP